MMAAASIPPGDAGATRPLTGAGAAGNGSPPNGLLAEIPEAEAGGDTLRIYNELRSVGGYELVPLFYRVLATEPAALSWAWHVLRPAFKSGVVAASARAAVTAPGRQPARLPAPGWTLLGLSSRDLEEARAVVAGFNAANPYNLTVVLLLEQALRDGTMIDLADGPVQPEGMPSPGVPHRPPLALTNMRPAERALVEWLSTRGGREPFATAPTLWRCLAHWPPLLAMAAGQLEPFYATGAIETAARAIRRSVQDDLAHRAAIMASRSVAAVEPAQADHVLRICTFFGGKVPEVILAGHVLQILMAEG